MPSKTKNKKIRTHFKIQKWKWYLIDLRNYHKPVLVRKHLDSKAQAIRYRDNFYDKHFDVIYYREAIEYNIRDFKNKKRRHKNHTAKYEYPRDCITEHQRFMFRKSERKKRRALRRSPKVTETIIWEILEDKPIKFLTRLSKLRREHWVFSETKNSMQDVKKKYSKAQDLVHIWNIRRTLLKYYDLGLYDIDPVSMLIYEKWKKRIKKRNEGLKSIPVSIGKIEEEFLARGFIKVNYIEPNGKGSYIESINLPNTYRHPNLCWHNTYEKSLFENYIYDFQVEMGIPGFTRAVVRNIR